jgi:hypothetical protein
MLGPLSGQQQRGTGAASLPLPIPFGGANRASSPRSTAPPPLCLPHPGVDVSEIAGRANPGVERRAAADKLELKRTTGEGAPRLAAAAEGLARKAALYERLARGEVRDEEDRYGNTAYEVGGRALLGGLRLLACWQVGACSTPVSPLVSSRRRAASLDAGLQDRATARRAVALICAPTSFAPVPTSPSTPTRPAG